MASPRYRVIDPLAPRKAADPGIADIADRMLGELQSRTPVESGQLAAGWQVELGHDHAVRLITNTVEYAKYVEFGTKNRPATPMVGPVLAENRGAL